MRHAALALLLICAAPLHAQSRGEVTFRTGGSIHAFPAAGTWDRIGGDDAPVTIEIEALHPDGTRLFLSFDIADGHATDLAFVFQEPETAERYGREWVASDGFGVRLTQVAAEGARMRVTGTYGGGIAMTHPPHGRARVDGTFALTGMEHPLYPPPPG